MVISSFEDLECYKGCRELRLEISNLVKTMPKEEQYRLADQLIRCLRSITNNIAEGYGRFHYKENAQFCRQSRGSLYELLDHLQIALEEKYISEEKVIELKTLTNKNIRVLNGYINYLVKQS